MHPERNTPEEQLLTEIDVFLASPRTESARARRIERGMPTSFAALRASIPAPAAPAPSPPLDGTKIYSAIAILTPFVAALLVLSMGPFDTRLAPDPLGLLGGQSESQADDEFAIEPATVAERAGWQPLADPYQSPPLTNPDPAPAIARAEPQRPPGPEIAGGETERLWSLQPRRRPVPPDVMNTGWPTSAIDRFILAPIEQAGLEPAGDAPPAALLRRVSYDLTGLPPTPEEVDSFLRDPSFANYVKVVDNLLARWQYGEKWARHWLDLAGYDAGIDHSWRYREYVIAAFNKDKPFNWFVAEQLAGDLLPLREPERRAEALVATGFLAMGGVDANEKDTTKLRMDQVDGQIDLVTRTFLGLSVACARCHDHKFDPVPQRDYYALAGIFCSTDTRGGFDIPTLTPKVRVLALDTRSIAAAVNFTDRLGRRDEIKRLSSQAQAYLRRIRQAQYRGDEERIARLQASHREVNTRLQRLKNVDYSNMRNSGSIAIGVVDKSRPYDCAINIGGDPHELGEAVRRGFLSAVQFDGGQVSLPRFSSGRLELAKWLLAENHPLTSRVYANRVWARLFGRGLVRSVDEFGSKSQKPTHPELLDFLANRFIAGDWSTKALVREIVLSRAYRLDSKAAPEHFSADPDNLLLTRRELRPLPGEQLRDSMITVAGVLSDASAATSKARRYLATGEFGARSSFTDGDSFPLSSPFRTIYLPIVTKTPGMLALFDCPEPGARAPLRPGTTSPTQALFMMNNEFAYQVAMEAAFSIASSKRKHGSTNDKVDHAFLTLLGRKPSGAEQVWALEFLREFDAEEDISDPGFTNASDPTTSRVLAIAGTHAPRIATARQVERVVPWTMLYHALMQTAEFRMLR